MALLPGVGGRSSTERENCYKSAHLNHQQHRARLPLTSSVRVRRDIESETLKARAAESPLSALTDEISGKLWSGLTG